MKEHQNPPAPLNAGKNKSAAKAHPYDSVFRTLITDCSELIIPIVNEMFDEHFEPDRSIIHLQNEQFHLSPEGIVQRTTDSFFGIVGILDRRFHIECQSTDDGSMLLRMFEYDALDALENSSSARDHLIARFPSSGVMFLRHSKNTPDRMRVNLIMPDGSSITYPVEVLKVQNYSLESIFQKQLWFLLPFYLFRYEHEFAEIENDTEKLYALRDEYHSIRRRLDGLADARVIDEIARGTIIDMSKTIAESLAEKYNKVRKGVTEAMKGVVLEYPTKTAYKQGLAEGYTDGKVVGHAEGLAEGQASIAALVTAMLQAGAAGDLERAMKDEAFRAEQLKKYHIE